MHGTVTNAPPDSQMEDQRGIMPNQRTASGFSESTAAFVLADETEFVSTNETAPGARHVSERDISGRATGSDHARSIASNAPAASAAPRGNVPASSPATSAPRLKRVSGLALPEEFFGGFSGQIKPPSGKTPGKVVGDGDRNDPDSTVAQTPTAVQPPVIRTDARKPVAAHQTPVPAAPVSAAQIPVQSSSAQTLPAPTLSATATPRGSVASPNSVTVDSSSSVSPVPLVAAPSSVHAVSVEKAPPAPRRDGPSSAAPNPNEATPSRDAEPSRQTTGTVAQRATGQVSNSSAPTEPAPAPTRHLAKEQSSAPKKPVYAPRKPPVVRREGRSLRIFVSTTIDVAEERVLARKVLERLGPMLSDVVDLEVAFWDHEPLLEMETFLNERFSPEEADIVISILGSRLGYRMPREELESGCEPYPSGTEYECASAVPGIQEGFRELLVYRKNALPVIDQLDEFQVLKLFAERKALDRFVNSWFLDTNARLPKAYRPFLDAGDFVETLQSDLADAIGRIVGQRELEPRESATGNPECWWKHGSPFLGLSPFEFQHAPLYLIQTRAAEDVLQLLRKQAADGRAFVLVVGAAGCGKSSFISAGVLPLLTEPGVIEGVGLWRRADFSPCDAPHEMLEGLAGMLFHSSVLPELAVDGLNIARLAQLLEKNPPAAGRLIQMALARATSKLRPAPGVLEAPLARLVLVVDGLEQMFMNSTVFDEQRRSFFSALAALARSGSVWILTTVRSDFYPRCQEYSDLLDLKEGNGHFDMQLPTPADIEKVVRMRAEAAGLAVEKNPRTGVWLDDELCDAASMDRARLYRLEYMLSLLYQTRNSQNALLYSAYEDFGRLEHVIATRVERACESLSSEARGALPAVLEQLAFSSSAGHAVGRAVPRERLRSTPGSAELIDTFLNAGLLSVRKPVAGVVTVRMVDEVWRACQAALVPPGAGAPADSVATRPYYLQSDSVLDFPEPPRELEASEVREPLPKSVPASAPPPDRVTTDTGDCSLDKTLVTAAISIPAIETGPETSVATPATRVTAIAAPVSPADLELECGSCRGRLRVETPGTVVICPHCSVPLQTPGVGKPTVALPQPHVQTAKPASPRSRVRITAAIVVALVMLAGLAIQFMRNDDEPSPRFVANGRSAPQNSDDADAPAGSSNAEGEGESGDNPVDTSKSPSDGSSGSEKGMVTKTVPPQEVAVVPDGTPRQQGRTQEPKTSPSLPPPSEIKGEQFVNSIEMPFRRIPAGEFMMGSPASESDRSDEERLHPVRITRPFYLGTFEVTQSQFQRVMQKNPSSFKGDTLPVESVTWQDANEFCWRLSELPAERTAGRKYRLPTEAEWEYACRAGSTTVFPQGHSLSSLKENFDGRQPYGGAPEGPDLAGTVRVGNYPPNAFGLHDMPGNVSEWCADFFDREYDQPDSRVDPAGPSTGARRVTRGGNWLNGAQRCRSAARSSELPRSADSVIGFRVVVYTP